MKKRTIITIVIVLAMAFITLFALTACDLFGNVSDSTITVTFDTNAGSTVSSQTINVGDTATRPANPVKVGYSFADWYANSEFTQLFDFAITINSNTTVFARWTRIQVAPNYTIPQDITAIFGQTLSQVDLPSGWVWANDSLVGSVGSNASFGAIYTPESANYYAIRRNIPVRVMQAPYTGTPSVGILTVTWSSSLTLAGISFPNVRWSWDAPTTPLNAGANQIFMATYVPSSRNFAPVESIPVVVDILQARPSDIVRPYFEDVAYGTLLSALALPDNFVWINPEQTIGAGTNLILATYTPTNTNFYSIIVNLSVNVIPQFVYVSVGPTGSGIRAALCSNGSLWTWGGWSRTQQGHGDGAPVIHPRRISLVFSEGAGTATMPAPVFTHVSAGRAHSMALCVDGGLWTWGSSFETGKLGHGDMLLNQDRPRRVGLVLDSWVSQVMAAPVFTQISAGSHHSMALCADGDLWTWGRDRGYTGLRNSVLGHGGDGIQTRPRRVGLVYSLASGTQTQAPPVFNRISAGFNHSMALDSNGNLWTWGAYLINDLMLGHGDTPVQTRPRMISLVYSATAGAATQASPIFSEISAGQRHSSALDIDGNLWSWGAVHQSQEWVGSLRPRMVTQVFNDSNNLVFAPVFTDIFARNVRNVNIALCIDGGLWINDTQSDLRLSRISQVFDVVTESLVPAPVFKQISDMAAICLAGNLWIWSSDTSPRRINQVV